MNETKPGQMGLGKGLMANQMATHSCTLDIVSQLLLSFSSVYHKLTLIYVILCFWFLFFYFLFFISCCFRVDGVLKHMSESRDFEHRIRALENEVKLNITSVMHNVFFLS